MNRDIDISASGAPVTAILGVFKYLAIRTADVAFQISFDGSYWQNAKQNDRWDKSKAATFPERVFFKALNGLAASVTIDFDTQPLGTQDTAQSVVLNKAKGCGGSPIALTIPAAKRADNTNYVYNAGAGVDVTKNNILKISGVVAGKKRKSIYFDNRQNAGGTDVCIFDGDGNLFLYLKGGYDSPVYETSSDFYVGGMGGNANNFVFNELFYEKSNA